MLYPANNHADAANCGKGLKPFHASHELLKLIQAAGTVHSVGSGSMLFRAGEPTRGVYIVLSGRFALWSGEDPTRITRIAENRCLMGLPATIRMKPYSLSAEAVADAKVCLISPEQFRTLLTTNPEAGAEILRLLAEEISVLSRLTVYEAGRV
jgi:CRP-like cAMP-binding protein